MQILDSNIIIAKVKEEEIHHQKANEIIHNGKTNVVFDFVLSEIYSVLLMRFSHARAIETIDWIIESDLFIIVKMTADEEIQVIEFLRKNESKLSFVDASLFIASRNRKAPLLSFDKLLAHYSSLLGY